MSALARSIGLAVVAAVGLGAPGAASADRAEAQWSARGLFGVARLQEAAAPRAVPGLLGGLSLALSYGLSNRLDLGAELQLMATNRPAFSDKMVLVDQGTPVVGDFTRRTSSALLLLGPTWRYGVTWIPVVSVSGGGGLRARSDGHYSDLQFYPEEERSSVVLDLAVAGKLGLERRLGRSLTVGAYTSVLVAWSPSAPVLPAATFSLGLSYLHYPLW